MGYSAYRVQLQISRTQDGLWHLEVPGLKGCWIDAPTLESGLNEIQEVIAMVLDLYREEGWSVPEAVEPLNGEPNIASIPVIVEEHNFKRLRPALPGKTHKQ